MFGVGLGLDAPLSKTPLVDPRGPKNTASKEEEVGYHAHRIRNPSQQLPIRCIQGMIWVCCAIDYVNDTPPSNCSNTVRQHGYGLDAILLDNIGFNRYSPCLIDGVWEMKRVSKDQNETYTRCQHDQLDAESSTSSNMENDR